MTPFVIERTYNTKSDRIWKALTNPVEMKKWYFDVPMFKAEVGNEFNFIAGKDANNPYVHLCKVTEVIPGKKLTHSWRYEGYAGESFVTWELFDEGEKTRVRLTHTGLETFPNENKDFDPSSFAKGWTHILGTGLVNYLS